MVSFLASVPVEQHATARERFVPNNDGNARKRKSGASGGASGVEDEDKGGSRRLRGDFPHAPVQQPAWLWPPAPLVRRGHHSTAVWRRAAAENWTEAPDLTLNRIQIVPRGGPQSPRSGPQQGSGMVHR